MTSTTLTSAACSGILELQCRCSHFVELCSNSLLDSSNDSHIRGNVSENKSNVMRVCDVFDAFGETLVPRHELPELGG